MVYKVSYSFSCYYFNIKMFVVKDSVHLTPSSTEYSRITWNFIYIVSLELQRDENNVYSKAYFINLSIVFLVF